MASFDDVINRFNRMAAGAVAGGEAAANAMASRFNEGVKHDELSSYFHPAHTWSRSPPGEPPSVISGHLRDSMLITPASPSATGWSAYSGPTAVYSRIQELGGDMHGRPAMRWFIDEGAGVQWYGQHFIRLPPRPYMLPAHARMIADGSLHEAAAVAFSHFA